jgi:hypothetical protein
MASSLYLYVWNSSRRRYKISFGPFMVSSALVTLFSDESSLFMYVTVVSESIIPFHYRDVCEIDQDN